jgi:hypothetical protein
MTDFESLVRLLTTARVEFILVGGAAATAHGSSRLTVDLDIVYGRSKQNLDRLASCLAPYHPYLRGAPEGLPFRLDTDTLQRGLNFTLITDAGALDLLGEIIGGGRYEDLLPHTIDAGKGVSPPCLVMRVAFSHVHASDADNTHLRRAAFSMWDHDRAASCFADLT